MQVCPRCGNVEQDGAKSCSRCHYNFPQSAVKANQGNKVPNTGRVQNNTRAPQRPANNQENPQQVKQPIQNNRRPAGNPVANQGGQQARQPQVKKPQQGGKPIQGNPAGKVQNPAMPAGKAISPQQKKRMQNPPPVQNQPAPQQTQQEFVETVPEFVSVKDWLILMLKLLIPVYNIITIVKLWKASNVTPIQSNYIKAYVIYFGIAFGVSLILSLILTLVGV